ncbi:MAG: type II secretion system protein [Phycisphaerales bacterium]
MSNEVNRAFSLIEVLVSVAIVAVLLCLLLPALVRARDAGYRTVCSQNLRQTHIAWDSYLAAHKEMYPQFGTSPEWQYGGVEFPEGSEVPLLATDRPINRYVAQDVQRQSSEMVEIFRCPADRGVYQRGAAARGGVGASVLLRGTCFREFGNSYRANGLLLDSTLAGIDRQARPLFDHEIKVDRSRLLLTGDSAWYYAMPGADATQSGLDATWHGKQDAGNMLAADGSVRFVNFSGDDRARITLNPRP